MKVAVQKKKKSVLMGAVATLAIASVVPAIAQEQVSPADALSATIDMRDVERFAKLWKKTGGRPTAAQLDAEYIQGGGPGVKIYTPFRIIDGANLAKQVVAKPELYQQAIGKCLPWVANSTADLRSIYLAMRGLLPEKPLPRIYMVIGGANSGGTAGPGAQVLGLEILCRDAPAPDQFRSLMRTFFAHETAHTFQSEVETAAHVKDPLLTHILREGGADYVATLVTGAPPSAAREAYGSANEAEMWRQFVKDRATASRNYSTGKGYNPAGNAAFGHWLYNGSKGRLPGWEMDMGYWLGMRIAKTYVEQATNRHAAIRQVLALDDPAEILRKSGYGEKFTH